MMPSCFTPPTQVLAQKGPTPARLAAQPWRLATPWGGKDGLPPLPVLDPTAGRRKEQQLLRRTITQLLRLIAAQASSFPPGVSRTGRAAR